MDTSVIETALQLRLEGRWPEMVSLLAPAAGGPDGDPRIDALLAEAWLLGGRAREAEAVLAPVLERAPDSDLAQAALARLKLRCGDRPGARAAADEALRLNPADPEHRLLAIAIASAAGRVDEALAGVDQLLTEHPTLAAAHARRAMLLMALRRPSEALASARAAAQAGFGHPDSWRLYFAVGDRPAAIRALERRLAIDPSDVPAMIGLGELLRGAGKTQEAARWFAKAVEQSPGDPKAWAGYGTTLQASMRGDEARAAYERALILNPADDAVALNLAAMDYKSGRYEAVIQALSPIITAGRTTPQIHVAAAKAAFRLGRFPEAVQAYEAALALDPDDTEALRGLGRTREEAALYARRAAAEVLTLDGLQDWLLLLASQPSLGDALAAFDRFSPMVRPDQREMARLSTYPLVARWALGDMLAVERLLTHKAALRVEEAADEIPHRFFHYIERLAALRSVRPELYDETTGVEEVQVIGESHALSPANLVGCWLGRPMRFRSRFILGAKMFSLGSKAPTSYAAYLTAYLAAMPPGANLLFTIGEIDCRPDEGIWAVRRRSGKSISQLAEHTVSNYLDRLQAHLEAGSFGSVTIQGVPAPAYGVARMLEGDERVEDFLTVFSEVNARLESGARAKGWAYLDTWGATAAADGTSNRLWHIDGYHLSPGFYTETADRMRRP